MRNSSAIKVPTFEAGFLSSDFVDFALCKYTAANAEMCRDLLTSYRNRVEPFVNNWRRPSVNGWRDFQAK